jgi:hypothetical protein
MNFQDHGLALEFVVVGIAGGLALSVGFAGDIHPNVTGYGVIAQAFEQAFHERSDETAAAIPDL